jgi:hypothetical protein
MDKIAGASFASLFGLLICAAPALAGVWFVVRPTERLLALMRPLTLAGIFSALCSTFLNITNTFRFISTLTPLDANSMRNIASGVAEGFAPVVVSFALLTVAWVCVAIGMRRG